MDTLVDHLFIFDGEGNIKDYNGNYTAYREEKDEWTEKNQIEQREEKKEIKQAKSNVDKKIGFKEKFEFEQLEKQIPELENLLLQLNEKLNSGISNHEEIMKVTNELGVKQQELEEKTNRGLELSEIIN
jgi:ATP-binding cassette subfamily F protein uup